MIFLYLPICIYLGNFLVNMQEKPKWYQVNKEMPNLTLNHRNVD